MDKKDKMSEYLLKQYIDIDNVNINLPFRKILAFLYNCKCTDCGGNDNTGDCLIEKDYYEKVNKFVEITYL